MRADAIELVIGDRIAARRKARALAAQREQGDARRLRHHLRDGAQALVLHALLRDDADRLRRFPDRQAQRRGRGNRQGGDVRARAFRRILLRLDRYFRHRGDGVRAGFRLRRAQHVAAVGAALGLQTAAAQHAVQGGQHVVAAAQAGRRLAARLLRREAEDDPGLAGHLTQRRRQVAGRHLEVVARRLRCRAFLRQRRRGHVQQQGRTDEDELDGICHALDAWPGRESLGHGYLVV